MYAWAQSKLSARTSPLGFPGEELEAHHEGVPGAVSVGPNLGDLPELVQPAHEGPRVEIPVAIVRAGPHLAEKDEKPGSLRPRRGKKKNGSTCFLRIRIKQRHRGFSFMVCC